MKVNTSKKGALIGTNNGSYAVSFLGVYLYASAKGPNKPKKDLHRSP